MLRHQPPSLRDLLLMLHQRASVAEERGEAVSTATAFDTVVSANLASVSGLYGPLEADGDEDAPCAGL